MSKQWKRRRSDNQPFQTREGTIPVKGEYDVVSPPTKRIYKRANGARSKDPEWVGMFDAPTPINTPFTPGWIECGQEEWLVEELVYYGYDERDVRMFDRFIRYDNSFGDRHVEYPSDVYGVREIRGFDENFKFRRTRGK